MKYCHNESSLQLKVTDDVAVSNEIVLMFS